METQKIKKRKIIAFRATDEEKKIWLEKSLVKKIRKWILKHG